MVASRVVLPLVSETEAPFLNAVPTMVTAMVDELKPEEGVIEVIVGEAFVTVKAFGRTVPAPSEFMILSLNIRVGAPLRENEHRIVVLFLKLIVPGILILALVRLTRSIEFRFFPVIAADRVPVFGAAEGFIEKIVGRGGVGVPK